MHDPLVVAFKVPRPWPKRYRYALAARRFYFPPVVTVWHREPGGRDSGTVCRRWWRIHAHHWRVQIPALQMLRRRLLTRCAWCGGRSRKGDAVNVSHSWDGPRSKWWRGELGLFHGDCSAVKGARSQCLCDQPGPLAHGDYGTCAYCGRFRVWRNHAERQLPPRMSLVMLASLPEGSRIPAAMHPDLEHLWSQERAERVSR